MTRRNRCPLRDPLVLAGLLVAASIWLAGVFALPLTQRTAGLYHVEPIGEIRGGQTVGQSFKAAYDGLYRIDISLADYGKAHKGQVYFRLKMSPSSAAVAEVAFPAEAIRGDVLYRFEFQVQPNSGGQWYYFELAAPTAVQGDALTAYVQPVGLYADGEAYVAGRPAPGDIVFDQYFRVTGWRRVRILLDQLRAGKPAPGAWTAFYLLLAPAYVALALALLRRLLRASVS